jgi:hypothetical protein
LISGTTRSHTRCELPSPWINTALGECGPPEMTAPALTALPVWAQARAAGAERGQGISSLFSFISLPGIRNQRCQAKRLVVSFIKKCKPVREGHCAGNVSNAAVQSEFIEIIDRARFAVVSHRRHEEFEIPSPKLRRVLTGD